jgi:hypothetical protein
MAVYQSIYEHFRKYLPPGEEILATIRCESVLGPETHRFCVTERRFAILEKKGLFSWKYGSIGLEKIETVWVDEGVFNSTVVIVFRKGDDLRLSNIGKSDARAFVSAFSACIDQDHEVVSQRTKVCPECDELVKYRANRCKHCGYRFS